MIAFLVAAEYYFHRAWNWVGDLFGNSPKAKIAIIAFIVLVVVLSCNYARAGELHLEIGSSIIHGVGPTAGLYYKFGEDRHVSFEAGTQLWGSTRFNNIPIQNNWNPSVLMEARKGPISAGLGFAYLVRSDAIDGTNLNFSLKLRMQLPWKDFGIVVRHLSNAGCCRGSNQGRNLVALDWRVQ